MSWRGVFAGALALIALEALLRSDDSVGRFGEMFTTVGELAAKAMSPAVAAIPNVRRWNDSDSGAGGGQSSGGGDDNDSFSGGGGGGSGGGRSW